MDWNNLKAEYIAGGISYRKLAKKHGISFDRLKNVAVQEHWYDLKEQAKDKATTKMVNSVADDIYKNAVKVNDVADKLLDKIIVLLDDTDGIDSQIIKQLTSSLKDIKDIKGVKSEIDLREQEARIEKLRKDINADNSDDDETYGVVLMPPIMDELMPPKEDDDE